MAKGIKDFVAEARARVRSVAPDEAHRKAQVGEAVLLDVREQEELAEDGALGLDHNHVPRGLLEAKADPVSDAKHAGLTRARGNCAVMVVCARGERAAMAADRLGEMGYDARVVEGGFRAWRNAGWPVRGVRRRRSPLCRSQKDEPVKSKSPKFDKAKRICCQELLWIVTASTQQRQCPIAIGGRLSGLIRKACFAPLEFVQA